MSVSTKPGAVPIDFSQAEFYQVEFVGFRFDTVELPPSVTLIKDAQAFARHALEMLAEDDSIAATVVKSDMNRVNMPHRPEFDSFCNPVDIEHTRLVKPYREEMEQLLRAAGLDVRPYHKDEK